MVPVCNLWTLASQVQTPYRYLVISHVTVSKVSPRCLILEVWSIWNLMSKRNCNIYTVQEICLSHVSKHFFQNFHYMALFHHALLSWKRMAFSYFLKIYLFILGRRKECGGRGVCTGGEGERESPADSELSPSISRPKPKLRARCSTDCTTQESWLPMTFY